MKMDVNSNKYTFIFSAAMVVVVALVLAVASESLKPFQNANVRNEKMQNILAASGIIVGAEEAQTAYDKYVTEEILLDKEGQVISNSKVEPFEVDVLYEFKSGGQKHFPVFVCTLDDGTRNYIMPMVGKGLWGPIWGFVAVGQDMNTLTGAIFDHKSETPGLGAEINQDWFQEPFIGKKLFNDDGEFMSVNVVKGGVDEDNMHGVDAISGGTITSNGVSEMIERTMGTYKGYLKSKMNN